MTQINSSAKASAKRQWAAPEVRRVRAGDAEQNGGSFVDSVTPNNFS